MSYRYSSNQSADRSLLIVMTDIVDRGFMPCTPLSRDTIYDLVVDRGQGKFETLQIKTLSKYSFSTANRSANADEPVSRNGKARNRYFYRDFGIDWMVGVAREFPHQLYYYSIDVYRHHDTIDVRRIMPVDFGTCVVKSSGIRGVRPSPDAIPSSGFDTLDGPWDDVDES